MVDRLCVVSIGCAAGRVPGDLLVLGTFLFKDCIKKQPEHCCDRHSACTILW